MSRLRLNQKSIVTNVNLLPGALTASSACARVGLLCNIAPAVYVRWRLIKIKPTSEIIKTINRVNGITISKFTE